MSRSECSREKVRDPRRRDGQKEKSGKITRRTPNLLGVRHREVENSSVINRERSKEASAATHGVASVQKRAVL